MKQDKKILIAVISVVFVMTLMFSISAKTQDLVLASVDYVDAKIAEVRALISTGSHGGGQTTNPVDDVKVTELETALGKAQKEISSLQSRMDFLDTIIREMSDSYGFQVLHLYKGDALYALGTSEIILRAGDAIVIGNEHKEGLSNITTGSNLKPDSALSKDHLVLIPRGDGRGIKVTSNECYVMFRGPYSYVPAN